MERGPGGEANRLHTAPQALSHDTLYTRLPKRSIDFALGGSRNRDHCKGGTLAVALKAISRSGHSSTFNDPKL